MVLFYIDTHGGDVVTHSVQDCVVVGGVVGVWWVV